jgi:hypothetical protein
MPRKRHKPEEIVAKLRQVDVLVSQGQSVADAVRSICDGGDVLSLAPGVRRPQIRPGQTAEGRRTPARRSRAPSDGRRRVRCR